jgi:hypothetical protein
MAPLPPEVIEALRTGATVLRTEHPRYGSFVFWCHHWPHPEQEPEEGEPDT